MRLCHQPALDDLGLVAALAVAAVAFPYPAAARPPADDAASARAEGPRPSPAKNVDAACPKFEKAAQRAPADPEPLADLALCRQRLGDTDAATKINRRVIDLGSTGKALTDPRFARSRRRAYLNLHQIDTQLRYFPEVGQKVCGELTPEQGCSKKLFYCADSWTGGGSSMTHNYSRVNIAATVEDARFDEEETDPDTRAHTTPDFDELTQPFQPTPEVVENQESVTYLEAYFDVVNESRCDERAWSCDRSSAVAAEVKKCLVSPDKTPTSEDACRQDACTRASEQPWPAVVNERKVAANDQSSCQASAAEHESEYGCQIAYANACTGLVGLICSGRRSPTAKERVRVEEYLFRPPPVQAGSLRSIPAGTGK